MSISWCVTEGADAWKVFSSILSEVKLIAKMLVASSTIEQEYVIIANFADSVRASENLSCMAIVNQITDFTIDGGEDS